MNPRAIVVAHPEAIAAEAIATALSCFAHICPIGTATNGAEAISLGQRADAVAIDNRLPDARLATTQLRRKGVRVVHLGEGEKNDDGASVSTNASVACLANALAPGWTNGESRSSLPLTRRETEILTLVSRGFSGKQAARHLGISPKTVENHKTNIFAKLGVPNQAAAVSVAMAKSGMRSWTPLNT